MDFQVETGPAVITVVLAIISPLVTAFFTKTTMSSSTKNYIALAFSALVALAYVFMTGGFDAITGIEDLAVPLGVSYGIMQFVYTALLKKPVTFVEANFGLKPIDLAKPEGEKSVVVTGTTVDGSEVVAAVPASEAASTEEYKVTPEAKG